MADTGATYAGTGANDSAVGTLTWNSPGNITASDNTRSDSNYTSGAGTFYTNYLKATNFGFSIPAGATIEGIVVEVEKLSDGNTANYYAYDTEIKIIKGGTIGSTNKATATHWPTSEAFASYGGASDLWGETWSAADINGSTFGVAVSAAIYTTGSFIRIYVDSIRITVYYSSGPSVSDSNSPTESVQVSVTSHIDLSDSGSLSEDIGTDLALNLSTYDSLSNDESLNTHLVSDLSLSDVLSSSESLNASTDVLGASIADAGSLSESLSFDQVTEIFISDPVSSSESISGEHIYDILITDALASGDSITFESVLDISVTDSASSSESVSGDPYIFKIDPQLKKYGSIGRNSYLGSRSSLTRFGGVGRSSPLGK